MCLEIVGNDRSVTQGYRPFLSGFCVEDPGLSLGRLPIAAGFVLLIECCGEICSVGLAPCFHSIINLSQE